MTPSTQWQLAPTRATQRTSALPRWAFQAVARVILSGLFLSHNTSQAVDQESLARDSIAILRSECLGCHSPEKRKGGLILTSKEGLLAGSSEGRVVVPGKPNESKLLTSLSSDAQPHMPPKGQLTGIQIQTLHSWIQGGLPWPNLASPTRSPVKLAPLPEAYHPTLASCVSPDGRWLASAQGGTLLLYALLSNRFELRVTRLAHTDAIQSLSWSADGHWIASGGWQKIALWKPEGLELSREWSTGLTSRITALEFGHDSKTLFAADGGFSTPGLIREFHLASPESQAVHSWTAHQDTILDLEVSADGSQMVSAGADRLIRLWDTRTHRERATLEGHSAQVTSVCFNSNATQIASAGTDHELKVWDVATREKIATLGQHTSALSALKWFSTHQVLFVAREDGAVIRFSEIKPHSGEQSSYTAQEQRLGSLKQAVMTLAVTPDRQRVFAGTQDGVIEAWDSDGKSLSTLTSPPPARVHFESAPTRPSPDRKEALVALPRGHRQDPARSLKPSSVLAISLSPPAVKLGGDSLVQSIIVTATTSDGLEHDVTTLARFAIDSPSVFELGVYGEVKALRPGRGILRAHFLGRATEVPVEVSSTASGVASAGPSATLSFTKDVLPALSKAGCNAGACHAKPEGQNGFRLSVFSYDPKSDYQEIVQEGRGRRVFPAAPDESLVLKKPTGLIPHEGGVRIQPGSTTHQLLLRWIRQGMPFSLTNEASLTGIEIFPKERRYKKGALQRVVVQAHYSDGSRRDVSRLATFATNDREVVQVEDRPQMQIGTLTGQGVVVARYMGFVADSQVLIPADQLLEESLYSDLPRKNFIDDLALAQFQELGLLPSGQCTDSEFLRRATLDVLGLLPTADEAREFASDPSHDKRDHLIARLLEHKAYGDYWANKWNDLLRPNPDRVGVKSIFTLDQWLRQSFRENKPYDQFVREILTAEGMNHREGPAVIYRDRREPADLTTMFSQLFLGTRLECARCHHHPNEKWGQEDFYQFAAYFGPLKQKGAGLSPPISAGMETFYHAPGGEVRHPVSGAVMVPKAPDGPSTPAEPGRDPRIALATWLTAPENPFFARAAVNRVWASFFGKGLVEPVDDFRISNPCVNPALLTALAEDFSRNGYNLKHLIRRIMESRLYQVSSTPNASNLGDTRNFSRSYRRRLPAEALLDAVSDITGVPESFAAMPVGTRAIETWSYKIDSQFMDAFGRPNSSSDCPCERDTRSSVVQTLHLMHSKGLQSKLSHPNGRVRELASGRHTPEEIITELYLLAYARRPSSSETARALQTFEKTEANRQNATEDVLWALLNSAEFVFNH